MVSILNHGGADAPVRPGSTAALEETCIRHPDGASGTPRVKMEEEGSAGCAKERKQKQYTEQNIHSAKYQI